jgi:tetratricopeptide (TPR) repeat protein
MPLEGNNTPALIRLRNAALDGYRSAVDGVIAVLVFLPSAAPGSVIVVAIAAFGVTMNRKGSRSRPSPLLAFCLLAASLAARPPMALAQMNTCGHTMETQDETPPDRLPAPQKMTGIGNAHMQITATAEAQMWFDQGLNLLHDFWDYESARAFEQSVRVDPQCAMCYWGLYEAESFYHSTAQGYAAQALAKAVSLKRHASKRERLYIEASAAANEDAVKLWRKLVREYPKETQARIFLAGLVDRKEALAILQSVLKDKPEDSAANHHYIHALEASEHPEQALHSAEILASLAPASGHMVHMPGHIFFRIGDYARAEQAFMASMLVDERYMEQQHVAPDNDWNYVHNLMYAIANLMEEGKLKDATTLSVKLTAARGKLESTLYTYSTRDSIARLHPRLPVALRTADWVQIIELLKASAPPATKPNLDFLARQLAGFAAGMQAVESHDLPRAEESSVRFDAELWRMSQQLKESQGMQTTAGNKAAPGALPKLQVMPDALLQPLLKSLSIMSLELRASLLTAQGKTSEAKSLFAKAAQEEKALGYREPPNYIRPVGETEGAAMMTVGDWTDAKSAYQQALLERPRSGLVLYGIAMSSEKSGDRAAAAKEYADFLAAWKYADPALAQVTHAQTYLAEHPAAAGGQR